METSTAFTDRLGAVLNRPGVGIAVFLVLVSIAMSFVSPFFLTWLNWANILNQSAFLILLAVGMTVVLIGGGIDLSVGAIAALSGGVVAWLVSAIGFPLPLALLCGILAGTLLGLLNGLIITRLGIPDFVTTLATLALIRGILLVWTQGVPIIGYSSNGYMMLGGLRRLPYGLTVPEFITAFLVIAGILIMRFSRVSSHLRAVGENPEIARLSGVNITRIKLASYALSGFLAGVVGVLLAGRLGTVQPNMAAGMEIQALAAAIIGGAALSGGRGSLVGAAIGALTLVVIQNVINLTGIPPVFETFVIGSVILVVITFDRVSGIVSGRRAQVAG
ncbi:MULTISPECIES: ABC transporter permease [Mameliella]|uniref:ABC transporter, membrane spanning protein (Ribose) n=1 Tax=Mameliella alba TaxID=561184 RepID=A0A0B3RFY6_9RHOB|nr:MULTISPECIES: ABC transporter permease [Mameliella]KHQ50130.1 ABC transporter, membrane spanning protein (Ribose) [Mameliella alba]